MDDEWGYSYFRKPPSKSQLSHWWWIHSKHVLIIRIGASHWFSHWLPGATDVLVNYRPGFLFALQLSPQLLQKPLHAAHDIPILYPHDCPYLWCTISASETMVNSHVFLPKIRWIPSEFLCFVGKISFYEIPVEITMFLCLVSNQIVLTCIKSRCFWV